MPSIKIVGAVFADVRDFLTYLEGLTFGAWRPKFITMHHTGSPSLATWNDWQTRAKPVSDEQWMRNLAHYYGNELGWSAGPHVFITPRHYLVLSDPTKRGVHAVSFNATAIGVEVVGDFDREPLGGAYLDHVGRGLAAMHLAFGFVPNPYKWNEAGLHFHRDDPKTKKTCPGARIVKGDMVRLVEAKMLELGGGADDPDEAVTVEPAPAAPAARAGRITINDLNVRADASARAPILATLAKGDRVAITGEAMNGATRWLKIASPAGWVAARFVDMRH